MIKCDNDRFKADMAEFVEWAAKAYEYSRTRAETFILIDKEAALICSRLANTFDDFLQHVMTRSEIMHAGRH